VPALLPDLPASNSYVCLKSVHWLRLCINCNTKTLHMETLLPLCVNALMSIKYISTCNVSVVQLMDRCSWWTDFNWPVVTGWMMSIAASAISPKGHPTIEKFSIQNPRVKWHFCEVSQVQNSIGWIASDMFHEYFLSSKNGPISLSIQEGHCGHCLQIPNLCILITRNHHDAMSENDGHSRVWNHHEGVWGTMYRGSQKASEW
jgi:hypothetical protein